MNIPPKLLRAFVSCSALLLFCAANLFAGDAVVHPDWGTHFLVTNDDNPAGNTATFYTIQPSGRLKSKTVVSTGGTGLGGGFFATGRVNVLHASKQNCVFVSDASSSDIAGIEVKNLKVTGNFKGSTGDNGNFDGIGLTQNGKYLYASFTASNTIGTFRIQPGCTLKFISDISVLGLNGGVIDGMSAHGNLLVATYADGSIESFNISTGAPKSNGDQQNSTGFSSGNLPAGVDITQDGKFAIFGDISLSSVVEVSDISSGKLTTTVPYTVGTGANSNNVWLSPDESLLYVANNFGGTLSAGFFNPLSGQINAACTSDPLKGFPNSWTYVSGLATELTTGTGAILYVAEWGQPSSIGIVKPSKGTAPTCSLSELDSSPAADPNSLGLLSIGVYPPRPF